MRWLTPFLLALLIPASLAADDSAGDPDPFPPLPPPAASTDSPDPSPIVAAGWCSLTAGEDDSPGCDVGAGLALHRWERLSAVAVVGTQTVGAGLAWTAHRSADRRRVYAVAVGLVARWDDGGVSEEVYPAVGATLSFTGGGR